MIHFNKIAAIILAGGKGTRIGQNLPKVLYPIMGKPMIHYSLKLIEDVGLRDVIVVIGYRADEVRAAIGRRCDFAFQKEQLGTGNALLCGLNEVHPDIKYVFVCNGDDSAFFHLSTIKDFLSSHLRKECVVSILTVYKKDPTGYGRILRDKNGRVVEIREEKEASDKGKRNKEVNAGCYIFDKTWLKNNIKKLKKNQSGEYYITDLVKMATSEGREVNSFELTDENQGFGINIREALKEANEIMFRRYREEKKPKIFFIGLDYSLLDSGKLRSYLSSEIRNLIKNHLRNLKLASKARTIFWKTYEEVKLEGGFVNIPKTIERFVVLLKSEELKDSLLEIFLTAPFDQFLYPQALNLVEELNRLGRVVVLEEGDLVYEPVKIRGMRLKDKIEDYFIFENLKSAIPMVVKIYKGWSQIILDDRVEILEHFLKINKNAIAVRIKQGKYSQFKFNLKKQKRFEYTSLDGITIDLKNIVK